MEFWRAGIARNMTSVDEARIVEAEGWDGQMFMDSASLSLDPYVMMGLWAGATTSLKLCTGVTNPYTRHLAVTAGSIASVQAVSGGRAILGLGRGDSALAYLGLSPVSTAAFGRAIDYIQMLLRREAVEFRKPIDDGVASIDALALGAKPEGTSLHWLPADLPKVPLDVAATGPKVIQMSAPAAEQITFSVGAIPERVAWALQLAREARAAHGLSDAGISYGLQILVFCHHDVDTAVEAASRAAAPMARFQIIQGPPVGPMTDNDRRNFEMIRSSYDMTTHGVVEAKSRLMGMQLDAQFTRRFTIAGSPNHCFERLTELAALGIDRFVCVGPSSYPESWGNERHLFVKEVMPRFR